MEIMKPFLSLLALVTLCVSSSAQTRIDAVVKVDSVNREFIVAVPSTSPPSGGYPLVFMFHGTSQDGEQFYNESQWKEKGEEENFIAVFPTALRYCMLEGSGQRTTTKWHTGEVDDSACPGQTIRDDNLFVQVMIDSIAARYPIDRARIFASGFSNGAGFASKLAIQMSDVFSAVAVSGGSIHRLDSARPTRNIPYWFVLGTLDDKWLEGYVGLGLTEFPFNDSTLAYMRLSLRRGLGVFGLDTLYTKDSLGRTLTYTFATPVISEPTEVYRFTLINNMFHVYPNGGNVPFVAANIFWEFFKGVVGPAGVPDDRRRADEILLYPNPTSDYLIIAGEGEMTLTIRTILGNEVFRVAVSGGRRIDISQLPRGVYVADIGDGRARMVVVQ